MEKPRFFPRIANLTLFVYFAQQNVISVKNSLQMENENTPLIGNLKIFVKKKVKKFGSATLINLKDTGYWRKKAKSNLNS